MKFAYALNMQEDTPTIEKLLELFRKANDAYHTGNVESPLTDEAFDELKDTIATLDPGNAEINAVGTPLHGSNHPLPVSMPSLNKAKHGDGDIAKWFTKHNIKSFVTSDKLDGVSILLVYTDGKWKAAYTRGDGTEGSLVTLHVDACQRDFPGKIGLQHSITVRAEAIMSEVQFEKYKGSYANPRNMVAGVFNRKELKDDPLAPEGGYQEESINIVCYEVVSGIKFSTRAKMFEWLTNNNFNTVKHKIQNYDPAKHDDDYFKRMLERRKEKTVFQLDGLVLQTNDEKLRRSLDIEDGNPASAIAFKSASADNKAETEVVAVEWNISHHGFLKPRLEVKPVQLSGVTVTHATAFNAKYISDNDIGPGAKILLTRSGDVIPHILAVIRRAYEPQMPDEAEHGAWE